MFDETLILYITRGNIKQDALDDSEEIESHPNNNQTRDLFRKIELIARKNDALHTEVVGSIGGSIVRNCMKTTQL